MSELAEKERVLKRGWAAPGGYHDWLIRLLKIVLPTAVGVLLAYLFLAPLSRNKEISFLLDKNKVEVARERLKVRSAQYRGIDNAGRPFTLVADRAVQAKSSEPVVEIGGMSANILLDEGPAAIKANRARYDMENQKVDVLGPILFTAADGYRLETRDVRVDLNARTLSGRQGVDGRMRLGRFSAGTLHADLPNRRVVLSGRARLHIDQGALR